MIWTDIIKNVEVYGIEESFRASKFPMAVDVNEINREYTTRIGKLAGSQKGEGHDNFLMGAIVQFDLTFTNKAWVEMERYHFADIVSSQSTMHRISKMKIAECCNEYVTQNTIDEVNRLKDIYLETNNAEDYLKLLYNIPSGLKLTARMTTNYRQLKTIYSQRKTHRLPEWRAFCDWVETLPYSELITGKEIE